MHWLLRLKARLRSLIRHEPLILIVNTPVIARTTSGAWIRGAVRSIRADGSSIGVLVAGANDSPDNLLWFKGKDLRLDDASWPT